MDLFAVVKLDSPRSVTVGVRPLREGETPILEALVMVRGRLKGRALSQWSVRPPRLCRQSKYFVH